MAAPKSFPVRFRDARTHAILKRVSSSLGVSMNEFVDRAVERELILGGARLEEDLREAIAELEDFRLDRAAGPFIEYVAAGEGLVDPVTARQVPEDVMPSKRASTGATRELSPDPLGVRAAFNHG
jgi:hypothetical protein